MDEQSQNIEEVVQEENSDVTQVADQSEQPQPAKPAAEAEQARNFRQIKEARERAERERDEAIRLLRDIQAKQQPSAQEPDDLPFGADDIVEGKHVKQVYKKMRELESELKQYKQQSSESVAETRLKAQYPDVEKVLSQENINSLRDKHPELANTIYNSAGDTYSKLVSAYTMIKNLGIHHEDLYEADRAIAQKNAAKPRPLTSIAPQSGESPLARANAFANGLTPELQKQLFDEMSKARRGY